MANPAIITCFHGRPGISRVFLDWTRALGIPVFAATSNDENVDLLRASAARWEIMPNDYLGARFNRAAQMAIAARHSHLIVMGSDDLLSPEWIGKLDQCTREQPWIAPLLGCIYNTADGRCLELKNNYRPNGSLFFGAATVLHATFIHPRRMPWPHHATRGLDGWLFKRYSERSKPVVVHVDEPAFIDLKSAQNMWSFSKLSTCPPCPIPSWAPQLPLHEQADRL